LRKEEFLIRKSFLSRKYKEGGIEKRDHKLIKREFERDWNKHFILNVSSDIIKAAGDLAEKHGLRGFDALHLASALSLKEKSATSVVFFSADTTLAEAAERESPT